MPSVVVPVVMIELLVVLAEEVGAVVAAIRRAHDGVHVMSAGHLVVEHDARMVVELDEDRRAVHPVVERRLVIEAAVPREPRLVEVGDDFFPFTSACPSPVQSTYVSIKARSRRRWASVMSVPGTP